MRRGAGRNFLCASAICASVVAASCSVYTPETAPRPAVELQRTFAASGAESVGRWWKDFDDEDLAAVIDQALADNLSLRMAWARLDQMRALARIAGAPRYPSATVAANAQRQRLGVAQPSLTSGLPEDTVDTLYAGLGISYQADLWQRIGNAHRASVLEAEASEQELESTTLAIAAAAGELWWAIAAQQTTLDLLEDQLEVGEDYLNLVQARFARGLASAAEVYQQRLQVETTRAQIPMATMGLELSKHQLAVLLGREPRAETSLPRPSLPDLPPMPATGVPLEVLRSRPDVRAAELMLVAADHRVAAAVADRYPSLSFGVSGGVQSADFSDALDHWFLGLAGDLLAPIFQGGRLKAEVDRNRAVVEERFSAWQATLLEACREVEDALARERGLAESLTVLDRQLEHARMSLERTRALYVNGLIDYLNVLTSLQVLQELERTAISTHRELLVNRVRLYLSLGGSWAAERDRSTPPGEDMT